MLRTGLRNRFLLYFLPLLLGVLVQGGCCVWTFSTIHHHFNQLLQDAALDASAMLDLKELLLSLESGILEHRIDRRMLRQKADQLTGMIEKHAGHKHKGLTPAEQVSHETLHHAIFAATLSKYILKESEAGWTADPAEFSQISEAIGEELKQLESSIDQHLHLHLRQLSRTEAFINEKYRHTLLIVILTSAVVIVLTVLVVFLMMRSVLEPVKLLQEGTRQIGMGNLDYRLNIRSGDEFEFLAGEFGNMAEQLAGYHNEFELKVRERTSELIHANAELRKAEEQVHTLSQKLLTVQEAERQQISLYLHDNVAQNLSSLKISGGSLLHDAAEGNAPAEQAVHDWEKLLDHCIRTVRELSYNLRPPGLEQIGLSSAIADYCREFSNKSGVDVHFTKAGIDSLVFDFDHAINTYRLVQEALNNIKKHADASRAEIRLIASHPNIILRMEDDGCGFDPEQGLRKALENKRFGLLGMKERVRMMQGSFRIHSAPQQGTKIIIEFPGPAAAAAAAAQNNEIST